MTGIVIANVLLAASVIGGVVGLLTWSIVTSTDGRARRPTRSRRESRAYRVSEPMLSALRSEPSSSADATAKPARVARDLSTS
ncbi:MAG TPA: hypothetical protein VMG37_17130 [Solirubrobacteraceae bacterium]|nr:hypothetical protein [Solirubrobacteraceae bacterium]